MKRGKGTHSENSADTQAKALKDFTRRCDEALLRASAILEKAQADQHRLESILGDKDRSSLRRTSVSPSATSPTPLVAPHTTPVVAEDPTRPLVLSSPPPKTSLFRRIGESLSRLSGRHSVSPTPVRESASRPRKSVRFDLGDQEEEAPPLSKVKQEDSFTEPPAPPPSEVSSTDPSMTAEEHREMITFIQENTIKKCLSTLKKEDLIHFLHGEGVKEVDTSLPKRKLLDEARALVIS